MTHSSKIIKPFMLSLAVAILCAPVSFAGKRTEADCKEACTGAQSNFLKYAPKEAKLWSTVDAGRCVCNYQIKGWDQKMKVYLNDKNECLDPHAPHKMIHCANAIANAVVP